MEQELIKELNQRIIKQFEEKEKDLQLKIDVFKEYLDEEKLDDDLLDDLKIIVDDMKSVKNKISRQIKRMKEKAEKGISLIKNSDKRYKNIITDSKYEKVFDFVENSSEKVEEGIDRLEELSNKINTDTKVGASIKSNLEKRINKLRDKKGKIQNRQTKIIDLATKEKLNSYLKEIKKTDTISTLLLKTADKSNEEQEKIDSLTDEKNKLIEMREQLFTGNLIDKGLGVKVFFNEKLTDSKLIALRAKKGAIDLTSRQLVRSSVNSFSIEKMKNKVINFGKEMKDMVMDTKDMLSDYFEFSNEPSKIR